MSMHFRAIAQQAAANGEIDAEEVLQLRRAAWPDGVIDPEEADAILTINDLVLNKGPEWTDFLIEAVCEYMLRTDEPRGYVSPAKSAWLIAALDRDGQLDYGEGYADEDQFYGTNLLTSAFSEGGSVTVTYEDEVIGYKITKIAPL